MKATGFRYIVPILFAVISDAALAKQSCEEIMNPVTQTSATAYRIELIRKLAKTNIPAVVRVNPDGSMIPVILMGSSSYKTPEVQKLIDETTGMGIDISQGTAGGNDVDHGLARAGKYYVDIIRQGDGMNIDPATGKTRYGSNELNYTALRSRNWDSYMARRDAGSRVQIELAYLSSPKDRHVSIAYHNLRRAGIINVVIESVLRFEKNWNKEWLDEPIRNAPRLMADGCTTINCFNNYMGTRIPSQIETMKNRIAAIPSLEHADVEALLMNTSVKATIKKIQDALAVADWKDPKVLHPHFVDQEDYLREVRKLRALQNLNEGQLVDVLSYLSAIQISREYMAVVKDQGADVYAGEDTDVHDHWPRRFANKRLEMDSANPRAVALFVYSDSPGAADALRNGTFEYLGAIWGYWRNGSSPAGNTTISMAEALKRLP